MTQLGEGVAVAIPPNAAEKKHDELELKITAITDAAGTSIKDGANEFDPRQNAVMGDTQTKIKFEVKNQSAVVFITIKAQRGSTRAHKYYGGRSVVLAVDIVDPGEQTFEWDGRTYIGRRFLIEGDYDVTVDATCPGCGKSVEHKATFKVRKPWAHCYGGTYGGHGALVGSTLKGDYTGRAASANKWLKSLADGSGFDSSTFTSESAAAALVKMHEESGVWFWGGHGGPGLISMPSGGKMTALVSQPSVAKTYSSIVAAGDCAAVSELPDNALQDVFLVVLCGCQTAKSPAKGPSLPAALVAKGVDIVIGFDLSIYTVSAHKWTDDFFHYLSLAVGIKEAVRKAISRAATKDFRDRLKTYRIYVGPGAASSAKLNPARYGRKKS